MFEERLHSKYFRNCTNICYHNNVDYVLFVLDAHGIMECWNIGTMGKTQC
jgi:hypothetical protein